jgi:SAM-dependent methyltransferase
MTRSNSAAIAVEKAESLAIMDNLGLICGDTQKTVKRRGFDLLRRAVPRPIKQLLKRLVGKVRATPGRPPPPIAPPRTAINLADTTAVRAFVVRSDELGGPDATPAHEWWQTLTFDIPSSLRVSACRLDPLSAEYLALQDGLYAAMVGGPYQETISELAPFDKEAAVAGHLAYPHCEPQALNRHISAMARLVDQVDRPGSLRILEAGSGWGFSCEYLARLGHRLVGVDVNPDFIETATRRSQRLGLGIDYRLGTFACLPVAPDERFDIIFTSAAFHHGRTPLLALQGMVRQLVPGGQVILASEPFIEPAMWPAWGLRADALSVYCIAKFGWWEAGWTRAFMGELFSRVGLEMRFADYHSDLERYMVGRLAVA